MSNFSIRRVLLSILSILLIFSAGIVVSIFPQKEVSRVLGASVKGYPTHFWEYQCLDTMKFSRDTARAWKGKDKELDTLIGKQMDAIVSLGGDCIALGTPYDEEFYPFMKKWVDSARAHKLKVWFRGNLSGFEGWFDYPKIAISEHHAKVFAYITKHPDLFAEGDIFTPSPESENRIIQGAWSKEEVATLKSFLITSYDNCLKAFTQINVSTECGYFSSNGDIARDAMDRTTVNATGKLITIDHYVKNAEIMERDILKLNDKYKVPVMVGEFGAPIPDIHGKLTEIAQRELVASWLEVFYRNRNIIRGVNYWTLSGGSAALYSDDFSKKVLATEAIEKYYKPSLISGRVVNSGKAVPGLPVSYNGNQVGVTDGNGEFGFLVLEGEYTFRVGGNGYETSRITSKTTKSKRDYYELELKKIE